MNKITVFTSLVLFSFLGAAQENQYFEMELLQRFEPALPPSGINGGNLGKVVANIGDINGDHFDDWAFGLPTAADLATSKELGKVYIYFGGTSLSGEQIPDMILQGEEDGAEFGCSVSSAGDVNNDDFDDIIIGAHMQTVCILLCS